MKDNSKCFILTPIGYEEITLAELKQRLESDPTYIGKYFIALHNMLMEVSEADYRDFYRVRRRNKYLKEKDNENNLLSYHALDTDEMSGEGILSDDSPLLDEQVAEKLDIETMLICFKKLDKADRKLLSAIYFDGKSERQISKETGIPRKTINYRKRKALTKLKKFLEN